MRSAQELQGISPFEEQPVECDLCRVQAYADEMNTGEWQLPQGPRGWVLCPDCQ